MLVSNYLDFNDETPLKKAFKISLTVDEFTKKEAKLSSSDWGSAKSSIYASLHLPKAEVSVNLQSSQIKATVYDYEEELKSNLLQFILFRPLKLILAHRKYFPLHTSMVTNGKERILILGPKNTGKSTFALFFLKQGFQLLCDDDCFFTIREGELEFIPFPTKMGLQDHTFLRNPDLHKYNNKGYRSGGKLRINLQHLYRDSNFSIPKTVLLFPRFDKSAKLKLYRLSQNEACKKLAKENLDSRLKQLNPDLFADNCHCLYHLTKKAICFEVVYNDSNLNCVLEQLNKLLA